MPFEGQDSGGGTTMSPGGFEFGVQGWVWGPPQPRSITFFLDNTALVIDQYGRVVRGALMPDGRQVRFADKPPDGSRDGGTQFVVTARPEFATHEQVIAALEAERIDWQCYEVSYIKSSGGRASQGGLTREKAIELQRRLIDGGNREVLIGRTIVFAGWPQLPYEKLKELKEVPCTPVADLQRIRDPKLRKDALKFRQEADDLLQKETLAEQAAD